MKETAINVFLEQAEKLDATYPDAADLSSNLNTAELPTLTESLLADLATCAAAIGLQSPRRAWFLMALADAAARAQDNRFLQARAAWELGVAANEYGRPPLVRQALERAERLFTELDEPGWLAATRWQKYVLAWAVPNLKEAVEVLTEAAASLARSPQPLASKTPLCQLSLAYALLVKNQLEDLPPLLDLCQTHFEATQDTLNLARIDFIRAAYLRRKEPLAEAIAVSEAGLAKAQSVGARADIGRFMCQMGFNHYLGQADYEEAANCFQRGIAIFEALDIPGWKVQCQDGMLHLHILNGRLAQADSLTQSILTTLTDEEAPAREVAAQLMAGWIETEKFNHRQSLAYLDRVYAHHRQNSNGHMMATVDMMRGENYLALGRYQQSLHHLEASYGRFERLGLPYRLAECGLRLARLWTALDNEATALDYFEKVRENAEKVHHAAALLAYHIRLAEHHIQEAAPGQAQAMLAAALALAREQGNRHVESHCYRLQAQAYCAGGDFEAAAARLNLAESIIEGDDLRHEQAAVLLTWGHVYKEQGQLTQALAAWEEAEALSRDLMPDLNWQASAILAEQARAANDNKKALTHYRQMVGALRLLRQGFWQPELADSYLKRPSPHLNQAVLFSAQYGRPGDTLSFIEETKAQTTTNQLHTQTPFQDVNLMSPEARQMLAEIRWLQKSLRSAATATPSVFRAIDGSTSYQTLQEKITAYADYMTRHQRQKLKRSPLSMTGSFDIDRFRQQANHHLQNRWVALDYYKVNNELVCLLLTTDRATTHRLEISEAVEGLLEDIGWLQNLNGRTPTQILKGISRQVLPAELQDCLSPDENTTLLIAPHSDLHRLPWAALHLPGPASGYQPLVGAVTPVIVPSLQALSLLWERPERPFTLESGLLLAVSEFESRPSLEGVWPEVEKMRSILGSGYETLLEEAATTENLLSALSGPEQLDYWHIASHAFHDDHSGHLSGLALHKNDFLLDEFWQMAPLPRLVTFSACGSSKSRLLIGDEHIGLTTTCLAAGADQVVGSIWNVKDAGMAEIMGTLYRLLKGYEGGTAVSVSAALAQAQYQAWKEKRSWAQWAGFRCTGRP